MRTTLTLDPDVSVQIEALRRDQGLSLKDAVNHALRRGLRAMAEGGKAREAFVTRSVDLGEPRVPLDDIAEALAAKRKVKAFVDPGRCKPADLRRQCRRSSARCR